jgi:hypothetical protein
MNPRLLRILAVLATVVAARALPVAANELQATEASAGFRIHSAAETLHDYCARDAEGRLWLTLPGGARHELVTSTTDPAIFNPGDGAFHPFDASVVREALAEVRFPVGALAADVFLLPYPRRDGVESAGGAGIVLLSPGVRPLTVERQHVEFVHELGHVAQRALMPDTAAAAWRDYRALRGIGDAAVYAPGAMHANRPHEIFAEDFRALFGDPLASGSGVENGTIAPPVAVPGLRAFLLGLATPAPVALAATPNPARGAVHFTRPGGSAAALDVFDTQGRRVAALEPSVAGGIVSWTWDSATARTASGVYYARPRDASGAAVRVTRLP